MPAWVYPSTLHGMRYALPCAIAAALLLASPASATTDPVSIQMLAAADACLDVAKGADPAGRFTGLGFTQHDERQWYRVVGTATVVVVLGASTDAKGGTLKSCTTTSAPPTPDYPGLLAGLRQRATANALPEKPARTLSSGSSATPFERLEATGVVSITVVMGKATEKLPTGTTSVVVLSR